MKKVLIVAALLVVPTVALADWPYDNSSRGSRPYEDAWGNNYKKQENLYKDTDRDGVINKYDYNDRNKNIQTPYQQDYSNPYKSSGSSRSKGRYGW